MSATKSAASSSPSGSLGHGLPFGAGKALAARRQGRPWRVFVMLSDGEMDEGSNWEAMMFAAHHGLDNLVALIDYNKLQSLTTIAGTLALEPLADKLRAFGWAVREVNGHDHAGLEAALLERGDEEARAAIGAGHAHDQGQGRQLHGEPRRVALQEPGRRTTCRRPHGTAATPSVTPSSTNWSPSPNGTRTSPWSSATSAFRWSSHSPTASRIASSTPASPSRI